MTAPLLPPSPSTALAPDENRLTQALRAEQLDQVYRQTARNQVISPLAGALVCFAMWPRIDHRLLLAWLAILAAGSVGRQLLTRSYLSRGGSRFGSAGWDHAFMASAALIGLVWGLGLWLMMRASGGTVDGALFAFATGMAGGTAVVYMAHGRTVAVTITCMLAPPALQMIGRWEPLAFSLAAAGILFMGAASRGVHAMNTAMRRTLELSLQLERQAHTDALSGLANRRALTEAGEAMLAHAARTGRACAALMVDIDHFKRINDTRGHAAGDAVIAALGALLACTVRSDERAGRLGGEEFLVLLPDAGADQATALAQRLLAAVRALRVTHAGEAIAITVSIGVAVGGEPAGSLQQLLALADDALYAAKHAGRDRLHLAAAPTRTPRAEAEAVAG